MDYFTLAADLAREQAMDVSKHTGGEWDSCRQDKAGKKMLVVVAGKPLAKGIENEYDAALMAAAPELLKACELALGALVTVKSYDWLRENIQSVIKKAKGEVG